MTWLDKAGYKMVLDGFRRGNRSTYFSSSEDAVKVHEILLENKYEAFLKYRPNNFMGRDETEIEIIGHLN